jgi:hypothetical protein
MHIDPTHIVLIPFFTKSDFSQSFYVTGHCYSLYFDLFLLRLYVLHTMHVISTRMRQGLEITSARQFVDRYAGKMD